MRTGNWTAAWEQRLRTAETEVRVYARDAITRMDQQIVPEIRREGRLALRSAARELHRLADALDTASARGRSR